MKKTTTSYVTPVMYEILLCEKSLICSSVDGMTLPDADYYEYDGDL